MNNKLLNLQALRGLAALSVFFHHLRLLYPTGQKDYIFDTVRGEIGVPIFFIISGFIMSYTTSNIGNDSIANLKVFLVKRLIRILPLYYFNVVSMLLINHSTLKSNLTEHLDVTLKVLTFQPLLTSTEGPFYGFWLLSAIWTLNYEMLFYFLFACSLLFKKWRYFALYIVFFSLLILLPYAFSGKLALAGPATKYQFAYFAFLSNPILLFFVIGVSLGLLVDKFKVGNRTVWAVTLTSVAIFLSFYIKLIPRSLINDLLICSLLVFAVLLLDFGTQLRAPKWLVFFGNISYSVYLVHGLVIYYLSSVVRHRGPLSLQNSWGLVGIVLLVTFLVSIVTYEILEKRFTGFLRSKLLPRA